MHVYVNWDGHVLRRFMGRDEESDRTDKNTQNKWKFGEDLRHTQRPVGSELYLQNSIINDNHSVLR